LRVRDYILLVLVLAVLCAAAYTLVPAYTRHRKTRLRILQLQESLADQEQQIRELREELSALRTDYRAIERVAREKFGLCLEDEQIYHFDRREAGDSDEGVPPAEQER
jgi:cell division protein FtsL